MSLHSKIYKINNSLISLFAILDSWCDREKEFLFHQNGSGVSPIEVLQDILVINGYVLSVLREQKPSQGKIQDIQDWQTTGAVIAKDHMIQSSAKVKGASLDETRVMLREQLFELLCILDNIHSSRLDPCLAAEVSVCSEKGLGIISTIISLIEQSIDKCRNDVEQHAGMTSN